MRAITLATFLAFVAQTHAEDLYGQSEMTFADKINMLADRAARRALEYDHSADLDTAVLGKPGNLAVPATSYAQTQSPYLTAGGVGALEEALEGTPDDVVVDIDDPNGFTEVVLGLRGGAKKAPMKTPMAAMKAMKTPMAAMKTPMKAAAMKAPATESVLGLKGGAKKATMKAPMAAMKAMKAPMTAMKAPMKAAMKTPSTESVVGLKGGAKAMKAMKAKAAPMAAPAAPMAAPMKAMKAPMAMKAMKAMKKR